MFTQLVPLDAAAPPRLAALAAVAEAFVSEEYVYLFRVVVLAEAQTADAPRAKIPLVLFPDADPCQEFALEAVVDAFVSEE